MNTNQNQNSYNQQPGTPSTAQQSPHIGPAQPATNGGQQCNQAQSQTRNTNPNPNPNQNTINNQPGYNNAPWGCVGPAAGCRPWGWSGNGYWSPAAGVCHGAGCPAYGGGQECNRGGWGWGHHGCRTGQIGGGHFGGHGCHGGCGHHGCR